MCLSVCVCVCGGGGGIFNFKRICSLSYNSKTTFSLNLCRVLIICASNMDPDQAR